MTSPPAASPVRDLGEAYAFCSAIASAHYENFPVASALLPRSRRPAVAAIYAFARTADDMADEPGPSADERLKLLADWRARLRRCVERTGGHDGHPVFWALSDAVRVFSLPLDPFERLLTAFESDVTTTRFETFDRLLGYCRNSADPVGELVLRLFGAWTPERGERSDAICTALQLTNFWQDMAVDALKGRLYVPLEDVRSFGLSPSDLGTRAAPPDRKVRALMAFQIGRTREFFQRGRALCDGVSGRLRHELRLVWLGGTRLLEKIERQDGDVWTRRPVLGRADRAVLFLRWMFWRRHGIA